MVYNDQMSWLHRHWVMSRGGGHQKGLLKSSSVFQRLVGGQFWVQMSLARKDRQLAVPGNEGLFALHFRHSPQACWAGNSLVISAGKKTVWTQERIISFDFKEIAKD